MRIAVLEVSLDPDSRSRNITRVVDLFGAAANLVPAPDLIVIPPGCDHVRHVRHRLTLAMVEMFQAALSAEAREWGVLVAVGLRRRNPQGTEDVAVLLDADGDQRLVSRPGDRPEVAQDTLFGALHLFCDSEELAAATAVGGWPRSRATIVLGQPEAEGVSPTNDRRKCEVLAGRTESCVILARGQNVADAKPAHFRCSDRNRTGQRLELPNGNVVIVALPAEDSVAGVKIEKS